jgi:hypothetical protein
MQFQERQQLLGRLQMEVFGKQLRFVSAVIDAKRRPVDAGITPQDAQMRADLAAQYSKMIMQILVSCAILIFSFYLLLRVPLEPIQKAAMGFIGTVVGYWLR